MDERQVKRVEDRRKKEVRDRLGGQGKNWFHLLANIHSGSLNLH